MKIMPKKKKSLSGFPIHSRNFFFVIALAFLAFVLFSHEGENKLTENIVDPGVRDESWIINECTFSSAEDAANEFKWAFGCKKDYCKAAGYGIDLLRNIHLEVPCRTVDQKVEWIDHCTEAFESIC